MANIFSDAAKLIRQGSKEPAYIALAKKHGATGALFGALIDIVSAGGRREFRDIPTAQKTMERAGYSLKPGGIHTISLNQLYNQPQAQRGGVIRVDTLPSGPQALAPPLGAQTGMNIATLSPPRNRSAASAGAQYYPREKPSSAAGRIGQVPTVGAPGSRSKAPRPAGSIWVEPPDPRYNDYTLGALLPAAPSEDDVFANEVLTPESSNVYGMAYDEKRGILYISYRAPGKTGETRTGVNGCNPFNSSGDLAEYSYEVRPFIRGPMYAYGSAGKPVTKDVWHDLLAANSKGGFIWDRLRVCGSMYEHQFPYALVSPSMAGELYVPRKATRLGFRVRAVPTVGRGRRPFELSNLPEQPYATTDPEEWNRARGRNRR